MNDTITWKWIPAGPGDSSGLLLGWFPDGFTVLIPSGPEILDDATVRPALDQRAREIRSGQEQP